MADPPVFSADTQPTLQQLIDYLVDSLFDRERIKQLETAIANGGAKAGAIADGVAAATIDPLLTLLGHVLASAEKHVETAVGPPLATLAGHLLGQEVSLPELRQAANGRGEGALGAAVAKMATDALTPAGDELQPGAEGAHRLLGMLGQLVFNGWFETVAFELVATAVPDMDSFESVAELPHNLVDALGLGRLARTALRPLAQIGVATPLEWDLNKRHTPTLLSAASALRQFARGTWEWEDVNEELKRHGYSDARISALLNEQRKFESVADVYLLQSTKAWTNDQAIKYLRDQGYDLDAAVLALRVEGQRRFRVLEVAEADALVSAYEKRLIDKPSFEAALAAHVPLETERALFTELADLRLALNFKPLSSTQTRDCVLDGILAVTDYRKALEDEGYLPYAVDALELRLRKQLDDKRTVAQHRAELAAEKAAAAAARAQAAAEKKAEIDAARALKQQGSIATLEDAYIRGLIPIERIAAVLAAQFPTDTVDVYLADVQAKRQVYVDNQAKAAEAAKRAANKGLSVADLQKALVEGILTVDQIAPQLTDRGLSDSDVAVLLHIMQDAAAAKRQADKLRTEAAQRAATKTLSLAQAEALVKAGHWTYVQLNAFLASLGYDAADVTSIDALVRDAIQTATAAAAIGKTIATGNEEEGLTLAQMKRGVELGTVSIEAFQQYLVSQRYSAAAVATLMADAQAAANTADAARARRSLTAPASDGRELPLATLTRAVQLGLLTPAAYLAALQARGYSDEDAALELDLLAAEVAGAKQPTPAAGSAEATLAAGAGSPTDAAQQKHVQVDGELAAKGLSLATVEKSAKAGDTTIDQYTNWLIANGYGTGDAEILTSLLVAEIQKAG